VSATILIEDIEAGRAAALIRQGQLVDLLIDGADGGPPRPGAIFAAKVERPIKGAGGALVALGDGQTGFLRDAKGLAPGQRVLVQVSTYAEPGKSAPVTRRLLFKSRYAIVTPGAPGLNIARSIHDEEMRVELRALAEEVAGDLPHGMILRSACGGGDLDAVAADIDRMITLANQVLADDSATPALLLEGTDAELAAWRDWPTDAEVLDETGAFDSCDVWSEIDRLKRVRHELPGGAWMAVERTAALISVDVNTGGDLSAAACLKANRHAARDLPRALLLRGLGGQVVVDFAPMGKKDRREIETILRAALRQDPIETSFAGWSNIGLAELVRKRERRPIAEVM